MKAHGMGVRKGEEEGEADMISDCGSILKKL